MFEKDAKLCLKTDQLLILQEYFQQLLPDLSIGSGDGSAGSDQKAGNGKRRTNTMVNSNKEFLLLYKSNQLHIIQDFMFKITNLKVRRNYMYSI